VSWKTTKNRCQNSRSPGPDLNSGLPEYKAGTTRPQRFVNMKAIQAYCDYHMGDGGS